MTTKTKTIRLIPAIASLLLVTGVLTVFSACGIKDDGTWMRCHSAQNVVAVCGAVMTVLFLICVFVKNKAVLIFLYSVVFVLAVAAFLVPGIIMPMCMMQTMRCYTVMQPFVWIMSVITAVFAVIGIARSARREK